MALTDAAIKGALAGLAGAAVMTAGEKVEQRFTRRPSSYVPGRTLANLVGLPRPDEDRFARNMAMHYTAGAILGALRGLMAAANLRGPLASVMRAPVRLTTDQILENVSGVGAPPWTWPRDELVITWFTRGSTAWPPAQSPTPRSPRCLRAPPRARRARRLKGFS